MWSLDSKRKTKNITANYTVSSITDILRNLYYNHKQFGN